MPALNWSIFEGLPGAATTNFELLCRSIVRRQYSQYGDFRALANQPGVEFHLKLHSSCPLGAAGRWFGWQCRWYSLPSGTNIGAARRSDIQDAIIKTEARLPGVTDWVLWTRHILTKSDQDWFYALPTKMRLHLWSAVEVEDYLNGPAAILRETYFGELVLTPDALAELHKEAVAPIRRRWLPEVHQVVDAEQVLQRTLGEIEAWSGLRELENQLETDIAAINANMGEVPDPMKAALGEVIKHAQVGHSALHETYELLEQGQYQILAQQKPCDLAPSTDERKLLRQIRNARHPVALYATNLLADMKRAQRLLSSVDQALAEHLVVVVADAGCGKTQLSAQLTAATLSRSAGLLLRGKHLAAGQTLDEFAHRVTIRGKPAESFEGLVAAVDGAGQRQGKRLPIVIDGLNEAEDPRGWKDQLASLSIVLGRYTNTQIICTLRSAFTEDAIPEGIQPLEIPGFEDDGVEAVRRYFTYYKIDATDAELPWQLLNHPLTLRMFCDVTNLERKQTVGVGAIPSSLSILFDRYLDQVSARISELSPAACRYYQSDVRTVLNKIGLALWGSYARDIEITELRKLLGDEGRTWNQSIVAALEHDGILFREPRYQSSQGSMSIVYDALAGHLVADALLGEYAGARFTEWLRNAKTLAAITSYRERLTLSDRVDRTLAKWIPSKWERVRTAIYHNLQRLSRDKRHPLANDIFRGLVGLTPYRMNRRQLWPLLDGSLQTDALFEAAYIDGAFLDQDTVARLAVLVREPSHRHRNLLSRLFVTRAAQAHPLNAEFLDSVLRPMAMADRDLCWSEWLRREPSGVAEDVARLERRWKNGNFQERGDHLRSRWLMWTLTTTIRPLRDRATSAIYQFGCYDPAALFDLTLNSLSINDPYVPERMLAACYGVAMGLWAHPRGAKLRELLPRFASTLVNEMFLRGAPYSTCHALTRGYALGTIALARKIDANCIPADNLTCLIPPYEYLPSPFPPPTEITDADIAAADGAMQMDFANYTLGGLVRNRSNYDYDNAAYKGVRRQIEYRIVKLGYSAKRFGSTDRVIANDGWRAESHGKAKMDRYGKKYSWIAFFEMYAIRSNRGEISEWHDTARPSEADLDPSFPEPPRTFQPPLPDLFSEAPTEPRRWLSKGPTPDYEGLLCLQEIDGEPGPWVLLQGHVEQSAPADRRHVFTFLRGILVKRQCAAEVLDVFNTLEYPGNRAIPEPLDDYYTYAGEIPWSEHFAASLRDTNGNAKRDEREAFERHDGKRWLPGILVEIPAYDFAWESYHSELNKVGGTVVPAPALCERLGLFNRRGEWDFYDSAGRLASAYREFKGTEDSFRSNLLFLRADLMAKYLSDELELVWLVWGERNFHFKGGINSVLREAFVGHEHIHRFSKKWQPGH